MVRRSLLTVALLLAVAGTALAYPKPSPVPYRWELHFYPGELRLYQDEQSGVAYWYFDYQVVNRTGRTQIWAPQVTCFTDAGEIMLSGEDVPVRIENEIIDLLGNPLIERQIEIIGDLLVGPENAKDGVAIWPARETDVNELSVFVRGISGESAKYDNPVTGTSEILYKTLQRDYLIPGNAVARGNRPAEMTEEMWILR